VSLQKHRNANTTAKTVLAAQLKTAAGVTHARCPCAHTDTSGHDKQGARRHRHRVLPPLLLPRRHCVRRGCRAKAWPRRRRARACWAHAVPALRLRGVPGSLPCVVACVPAVRRVPRHCVRQPRELRGLGAKGPHCLASCQARPARPTASGHMCLYGTNLALRHVAMRFTRTHSLHSIPSSPVLHNTTQEPPIPHEVRTGAQQRTGQRAAVRHGAGAHVAASASARRARSAAVRRCTIPAGRRRRRARTGRHRIARRPAARGPRSTPVSVREASTAGPRREGPAGGLRRRVARPRAHPGRRHPARCRRGHRRRQAARAAKARRGLPMVRGAARVRVRAGPARLAALRLAGRGPRACATVARPLRIWMRAVLRPARALAQQRPARCQTLVTRYA